MSGLGIRAGEVIALLDRHAGSDHLCAAGVDAGHVAFRARTAGCRVRTTETGGGGVVCAVGGGGAVVVVLAGMSPFARDGRGGRSGCGLVVEEGAGCCGVGFGEGVGDVVACVAPFEDFAVLFGGVGIGGRAGVVVLVRVARNSLDAR